MNRRMEIRIAALLAAMAGGDGLVIEDAAGQSVLAQPAPAQTGVVATPPADYFAGPWPREDLTAEQMDSLLAPIALYPDPLLAQMLPASTYPVDIIRAKRMADAGMADAEFDASDLDPSVKAIAKYADVLKMMDEHIAWTERLGQAFSDQQDAVMDSIQQLRVQAKSLGNLASTAQQVVQYDQEKILIVPTTEYVYVPYYQPSMVYYQACPPTYYGFGSPYITWSYGFTLGSWLNLDCDWHRHCIYRPYGWTWYDYRYRGRYYRPWPRDDHWRDHDHGRGDNDRGRWDRGGDRDGRDGSDDVWRRDPHKPMAPGGKPRERAVGVNPDDFRGRLNDGGRGREVRPGTGILRPPEPTQPRTRPDRAVGQPPSPPPQTRPTPAPQQPQQPKPEQPKAAPPAMRPEGPKKGAAAPVAPTAPTVTPRTIDRGREIVKPSTPRAAPAPVISAPSRGSDVIRQSDRGRESRSVSPGQSRPSAPAPSPPPPRAAPAAPPKAAPPPAAAPSRQDQKRGGR